MAVQFINYSFLHGCDLSGPPDPKLNFAERRAGRDAEVRCTW